MKINLCILTAFWAVLTCVFAQKAMPEQAATLPISDQVERAINLLSGAGWADAQKLAGERDTLATALPNIVSEDMRSADFIVEKASSSDLLMQAIYQGLLAATNQGIDCKDLLPKFFEKVSKSRDPEDIPDRSRFWVMRDTMLRNLAIRIVRAVEHRELTADEIVEIAGNPSGWIKTVYPTPNDRATTSEPFSNDVKTSFPRSPTEELVNQSDSAPPEVPNASAPWSIIAVLVLAVLGLLWFLLKWRS
jgi:hypothetical protein